MTLASLHMLAWIAGTAALFWAAPARLRHLVLAGVTLAFLALYAPASGLILGLLTLGCWWLPRLGPRPRDAMAAGAVAIAGLFLAYKTGVLTYGTRLDESSALLRVAMPLGLAFYGFRCIHYLVERTRGRLPAHGFDAFVGYLFFLPTLVAGPIHRFPDYQRDLAAHGWRWDRFSCGLERILYGFAQVVVLGNWFASTKLPELIAGIDPSRQALIEYLDAVRFGLNLYFQFAGYSNIAIGFALLLGFKVIENFDWPFLRKNIAEFWKAWHISLTSWCRAYICLPVARATHSAALGVLIALLAFALWHELSARYLAWGLYHALGLLAWYGFQRVKPATGLVGGLGGITGAMATGLSVAVTFNFVMLSFVLTKEATLADSLGSYSMILFGGW